LRQRSEHDVGPRDRPAPPALPVLTSPGEPGR
jgi:hypothetical protein